MITRFRVSRRVALVALLVIGFANVVIVGAGAVAVLRDQSRLSEHVDAAQRDEAALRESERTLDRRISAEDEALQGLAARTAAVDAALASQFNAQAVADKVAPSVFEVDAGDATGTGWVASQTPGSSLIVTNYHVVADVYTAGFRNVNLIRGKSTFSGTILRVDEPADLAVVSTHASLPALTRSGEAVSVGEPVLVVGSALGLEGSISTGVVSGLRVEDGRSLIQFTAPVSPGDSGGPVVDHQGHVIGITELKISGGGAEGLGFAIPVSAVCSSLEMC
jgi:putative serine protease PepD